MGGGVAPCRRLKASGGPWVVSAPASPLLSPGIGRVLHHRLQGGGFAFLLSSGLKPPLGLAGKKQMLPFPWGHSSGFRDSYRYSHHWWAKC